MRGRECVWERVEYELTGDVVLTATYRIIFEKATAGGLNSNLTGKGWSWVAQLMPDKRAPTVPRMVILYIYNDILCLSPVIVLLSLYDILKAIIFYNNVTYLFYLSLLFL